MLPAYICAGPSAPLITVWPFSGAPVGGHAAVGADEREVVAADREVVAVRDGGGRGEPDLDGDQVVAGIRR